MAGKRPWWQVTNTARQSFLFAALWAVLAVVQWALVFDKGDAASWLNYGIAIGWTALAVAYLGSGVLMRSRRRTNE